MRLSRIENKERVRHLREIIGKKVRTFNDNFSLGPSR